MTAAEFNARYPVGTPVLAYPGARPEDIPSATRLVTRTRTEAQPVGLDRDGVVWVEGHGAYIALTHIDPVPLDEWEAAKAAEVLAAEQAPRDTFAPWLAQRFDPQGAPWGGMSEDDRSYWEHHAAAVRRAVARGGFKSAEATS